MASLMLGTCKGCGHPAGMHSSQGKWMHYYHKLGPYVLSVDCKDRKMFHRVWDVPLCHAGAG